MREKKGREEVIEKYSVSCILEQQVRLYIFLLQPWSVISQFHFTPAKSAYKTTMAT